MTPDEQAMLTGILDAVRASNAAMSSLITRVDQAERQLVALAHAVRQINSRLQLQEAGTAMYEVVNMPPGIVN